MALKHYRGWYPISIAVFLALFAVLALVSSKNTAPIYFVGANGIQAAIYVFSLLWGAMLLRQSLAITSDIKSLGDRAVPWTIIMAVCLSGGFGIPLFFLPAQDALTLEAICLAMAGVCCLCDVFLKSQIRARASGVWIALGLGLVAAAFFVVRNVTFELVKFGDLRLASFEELLLGFGLCGWLAVAARFSFTLRMSDEAKNLWHISVAYLACGALTAFTWVSTLWSFGYWVSEAIQFGLFAHVSIFTITQDRALCKRTISRSLQRPALRAQVLFAAGCAAIILGVAIFLVYVTDSEAQSADVKGALSAVDGAIIGSSMASFAAIFLLLRNSVSSHLKLCLLNANLERSLQINKDDLIKQKAALEIELLRNRFLLRLSQSTRGATSVREACQSVLEVISDVSQTCFAGVFKADADHNLCCLEIWAGTHASWPEMAPLKEAMRATEGLKMFRGVRQVFTEQSIVTPKETAEFRTTVQSLPRQRIARSLQLDGFLSIPVFIDQELAYWLEFYRYAGYADPRFSDLGDVILDHLEKVLGAISDQEAILAAKEKAEAANRLNYLLFQLAQTTSVCTDLDVAVGEVLDLLSRYLDASLAHVYQVVDTKSMTSMGQWRGRHSCEDRFNAMKEAASETFDIRHDDTLRQGRVSHHRFCQKTGEAIAAHGVSSLALEAGLKELLLLPIRIDGRLELVMEFYSDTRFDPKRLEDASDYICDQLTKVIRGAHATLALQVAKTKAEEAVRVKTDFLATMSHEIRTPLNGVIGMAQLLSRTALSPLQARHCDTITKSSHHLLELINQVLDFSKLEAGQMRFDTAPFDLSKLCDEVLAPMVTQQLGADVELLMKYAPGTPQMVVADRARIAQILMNLVSNALKFTAKGHVQLQVTARVVPGAAEGVFHFCLSDTGVGMTEEAAGRIFDRFEQAETSTTRRFGGTGLGLSIVREIVDIMGGTISVISTVGQGSCFHVELTLPLVRAEPAGGPEILPASLLTGKSILILDALAPRRAILEDACRALDLNVSSGDIQATFCADMAAKAYDFLLLDDDILAAKPEAFEALAEALENKSVQPAIVLCSRFGGQEETINSALAIDRILPKPLQTGHLKETLLSIQQERKNIPSFTQKGTGDESGRVSRFLRGKTVLLCEDDRTSQTYAEAVLVELGARVICAEDGFLALKRVKDALPDIVLMDCNMPKLDGFKAAQAMRETMTDGLLSPAPIFACTAEDPSDIRAKSALYGMDDVLSKPLDPAELERALCAFHAHHNAVPAQVQPGRQTALVMLVEDNRVNREYATLVLEEEGCAVVCAEHGQEALDLLATTSPDMVLMDWHMPVMDGLEATKAIRSGLSGQDKAGIPIVALTASALEGDREKCLAVGMDDYVTKPIMPETLLALLQKCIAGYAPHGQQTASSGSMQQAS